jgi:hypothetical protein
MDPLLTQLPQMAPVQMGEKSPDICLHSPGDGPRSTLLTPLVERLVLTVPFAQAMGDPMTCRREDGLQNPHHRALDHRVLAAGFASRPRLPVVLLDPYPVDGRRYIPIIAQPLVQVPEVVVEVLSLLLARHLVHPRCTVFTGLALGVPHELPVHHVQHVVAHQRWSALGLGGNSLALHGYGW